MGSPLKLNWNYEMQTFEFHKEITPLYIYDIFNGVTWLFIPLKRITYRIRFLQINKYFSFPLINKFMSVSYPINLNSPIYKIYTHILRDNILAMLYDLSRKTVYLINPPEFRRFRILLVATLTYRFTIFFSFKKKKKVKPYFYHKTYNNIL